MSKVVENMSELVGGTPLLRCSRFAEGKGLKSEVYAKLECFNPSGSVKDRIAHAMIEKAEKDGRLKAGATIVEPTSGNTGIGIAAAAAARGYRAILVMPETMSLERRKLIQAYGAEIVLTEGSKGMKGAIAKAESIVSVTAGAMILSQFENLENPASHERTTGPEIYETLGGKVDLFVAGVGTGGTLSGVGAYLKKENAEISVIAVEPSGSPVLTKGVPGVHKIQGIGAGFIPTTLNKEIYDEVITVTDEEAFEAAREFAKQEGILVGISSGAALHAASVLAKKEENVEKNIVIILPDTGERYLSTDLFVN